MKRGAVGPLVAIILGIVVILIILLVFGKPLYEYASALFSPEGLLGKKEQNQGDVLIPGTEVKEGQIPRFLISGTTDEMVEKFADLLLECWKQRDKQNYRCFEVTFDIPSDRSRVREARDRYAEFGISLETVSSVLRDKRKEPGAAEALEDNSVAGVRRYHDFSVGFSRRSSETGEIIEVMKPSYLICVDNDIAPNDDDLFVSDYNGYHCE